VVALVTIREGIAGTGIETGCATGSVSLDWDWILLKLLPMTNWSRRANSIVLMPVDDEVELVLEVRVDEKRDPEALLATLSIVCLPVLESVDCLKLLGAGRWYRVGEWWCSCCFRRLMTCSMRDIVRG